MKKVIIIFMVFLSFFCFCSIARAEEEDFGFDSEGFYLIEDDGFMDFEDPPEEYEEDENEPDYEEDENEPDYEENDDWQVDNDNQEEIPEDQKNEIIMSEAENEQIFEANKESLNGTYKSKGESGKVGSAIIILIVLAGFYIGWQRGFIKEVTDFVALFISMILSALFKNSLANMLYTLLPFFKYSGSINKLLSLNIIFYQVIIYLLLLMFFLGIYQLIIRKLKIKEKIVETMVETNLVFNILGTIIGGPLMALFLYNVLLFAKLPMFNLDIVNNSKYANLIMEKTLIVSDRNKAIYSSNEYVLNAINNEELKIIDRTYLDNKITTNMISNKLIKEEKVKELYDKGLLQKYEQPLENEEG